MLLDGALSDAPLLNRTAETGVHDAVALERVDLRDLRVTEPKLDVLELLRHAMLPPDE
jgi:hypothetical protein